MAVLRRAPVFLFSLVHSHKTRRCTGSISGSCRPNPLSLPLIACLLITLKNNSPKRKRRDYLNNRKAMIAVHGCRALLIIGGRNNAQIIMSLTLGSPLGLHAFANQKLLLIPFSGPVFWFQIVSSGFGTFACGVSWASVWRIWSKYSVATFFNGLSPCGRPHH